MRAGARWKPQIDFSARPATKTDTAGSAETE
jgi:hypothetical protein